GGPSMIRSAAKNYRDVVVVVDANDYEGLEKELDENGEISLETRFKLSAKTFRHTAAYDALIADYLSKQAGENNPEKLTLTYDLISSMRYGENSHQKRSEERRVGKECR